MTIPFLGNVTEVHAKHNVVSSGTSGNKSSSGFQGTKHILKCTYCNKEGHTRDFCFKPVGYPDKKKGKGKQTNSNVTGFRPLSQPLQNPQSVSANNVEVVSQGNISNSGQQFSNANAGFSLEQLHNQVSHMKHLMLMMMNKKGKGNFSSLEDQVNSMTGMTMCLHSSVSHIA